MIKKYQDKEWLYQKYIIEKLSLNQIAKLCNCGKTAISCWLKKYQISSRSNSESHKNPSEETRRKIGEATKKRPNGMLGKKQSKETKQKIRIVNIKNALNNPNWGLRGKKQSKETKQKLSDIRKNNPKYIGKNHPFYGKHHSEESKNKNSEAHKGRYHSEEAKNKMSKSGKGRIFSEEHKGKIGEANKKREWTKMSRKKLGKAQEINWQNPEYRERMLKSFVIANKRRPTNPEKVFNELTPECVRYVGNGQWWRKIDGHYRNPDFKITGQNKVIEIYGDYWHRNDNPDDLINEYKEVGLECLVFWESEVYKETDKVMEKVKEFITK